MPIAKSQPLKLQSVDQGDLKRISSTEENYLAYLVGSHLIESDSDVGNITLSSSGNTLIGSFEDTFFNEADGTHPASAITSGSTTTNLYQVAGTADESDSDFRRPVAYNDGVVEMADSDLNILIDRINGRIGLSDYLGQFHLGTSAPSGDYNVFIGGAFTDTVNDSTVNTYNIYRRETQSAPTSILDSASNPTLIMSVKRSLGDSGDFEGLQRMTERQVKVTLGQRAKTRRSTVNGIGSYQLRSSSEGAPVSGLWRAVGTASNTKKVTAEISYTRTRTSAFTRTRNSAFTRDRSSAFARTRVSNFTRDSVQDFTRDFIGNFIGNYTRDFAGDFVGNYTRDFIGNFIGDFTRNRVSTFTRTSTRTRTSAYTRTSTRARVSNFTRVSTRTLNFQRVSTRTSTRNFIGDYVGQRTTNFTRTSSYTRAFVGDFIGNYSRAIFGEEDFTRTSTRTRVTDSTRVRSSFFIRFPLEPEVYSRDFTATFTGDFVGNFVGNYTRTVIIGDSTFTRNRTSERISSFNRTLNFIGNFDENFTRTRASSYTGDFLGDYTRTGFFTGDYTRNFAGDFIGNYTRNFAGNFIGNYSRTFIGEYTTDFTRTRVSAFTRTSTRTRTSIYTRDSVRTRTSAFTGNFVGDYTRNFIGDYSRNFVGDYTRNFIGNYSRNFLGNYTGDTIQPTTSTVETYTLYVRYG